MQAVFSPMPDNTETFSTPPSTPTGADHNILDHPSLSRRNSSRPSQLRIHQGPADWATDIVLVDSQTSPEPMATKVPTPATAIPPHLHDAHVHGSPTHTSVVHALPASNGAYGHHPAVVSSPLAPAPSMTHPPTPHSAVAQPTTKSPHPLPPLPRQASPMRSPCFVHSKLQGPSFQEWLREKHIKAQEARLEGPNGAGPLHPLAIPYTDGTLSDVAGLARYHVHEEDEDEQTAGSLTKQLAETAVGVREMSKQLGEHSTARSLRRCLTISPGRTRVHSSIQSILIVTKARDNRLIKLTRELALYLMLKPQKSGRGMIVCAPPLSPLCLLEPTHRGV